MNWTQTVRMALKSILNNKIRSLLTMLGIIIGIASVVSVVALGRGAGSVPCAYSCAYPPDRHRQ